RPRQFTHLDRFLFALGISNGNFDFGLGTFQSVGRGFHGLRSRGLVLLQCLGSFLSCFSRLFDACFDRLGGFAIFHRLLQLFGGGSFLCRGLGGRFFRLGR